MLSNIEYNTSERSELETWAHRIAFTQAVRREDSAQLRRITKDRIVEFAESVDDIFIAYEALHESDTKPRSEDAIAVGIFYFEESDENASYDW
jgi:hypothetical protein